MRIALLNSTPAMREEVLTDCCQFSGCRLEIGLLSGPDIAIKGVWLLLRKLLRLWL